MLFFLLHIHRLGVSSFKTSFWGWGFSFQHLSGTISGWNPWPKAEPSLWVSFPSQMWVPASRVSTSSAHLCPWPTEGRATLLSVPSGDRLPSLEISHSGFARCNVVHCHQEPDAVLAALKMKIFASNSSYHLFVTFTPILRPALGCCETAAAALGSSWTSTTD